MATSLVQIVFEAIDRATSTVDRINDRINGMTKGSSAFGSALNGALAGAGMAAFNTAVNLASNAVSALGDQIQQASQRQQDLIGGAQGLAVASQKPLQQSIAVMRDLNKEIARNVAALPGATQGYIELATGIADNLVPAAKDLSGQLDPAKLRAVTNDITRIYGIIGQGQPVAETVSTLSRAFNGNTTLAGLRQLRLFQGGTGAKVLEQIQQELLRQGKKDITDLTDQARIEIFRDVGKLFVSDEYIAELNKTYDGAMAVLADRFAKMFDLNMILSNRNNQAPIDAARDVLIAINTLFNSIADAFGITPEATLTAVYDGLKMVEKFINGITFYFDKIRGIFSDGFQFMDVDMIFNIFNEIGNNAGQAFYNWMSSIDWAEMLINIGRVSLVVFAALAGLISGLQTQAIGWLGDQLTNIWNTIIAAVGQTIKDAGSAIQNKFNEIISGISNLIQSLIDIVKNKINEAKNTVQRFITGNNANNNANATNTGSGITSGRNTYNAVAPQETIAGTVQPIFNLTVNTAASTGEGIAGDIMTALDKQWSEYKAGFA